MLSYDENWKHELQIHLNELRERVDSVKGNAFLLDKPLLYSAFITRKLFEDTAVTDKLRSKSITAIEHKSTRNGAEFFLEAIKGLMNVEDHFDLTRGTRIKVSYYDLASEIIHSDGLIWVEDDGFVSFFVFSYRNRLKRLLSVPIEGYAKMLEAVLKDQPKKWFTKKDLKTNRITRHSN